MHIIQMLLIYVFGSICQISLPIPELKTMFIINQHSFDKKQKANVILVFVEIIISI